MNTLGTVWMEHEVGMDVETSKPGMDVGMSKAWTGLCGAGMGAVRSRGMGMQQCRALEEPPGKGVLPTQARRCSALDCSSSAAPQPMFGLGLQQGHKRQRWEGAGAAPSASAAALGSPGGCRHGQTLSPAPMGARGAESASARFCRSTARAAARIPLDTASGALPRLWSQGCSSGMLFFTRGSYSPWIREGVCS